MISCKNCGALSSEGSQVCGNCGASLLDLQSNIESINQQNSDQNQTLNQEFVIDDNVLVNAYIGKNVDTLRNGKFSWCTLFFGGIYFWFRKMYGLLGIWFLIFIGLGIVQTVLKYVIIANSATIITAASNVKILKTVFEIIELIVPLVMAFQFKDLYIKHVKEKVLVIKNQNPNKTEAELVEICKNKGGTTIVPIIIFAVCFIAGFVYILIISVFVTSSYVDKARANAFADNALRAVEAVRTDIITNGKENNPNCQNFGNVCQYTLYQINDLVEVKFTKSSYGKEYKYVQVLVGATNEYSVCMIDKGNNGFKYTNVSNVNSSIVLVGKAPYNCG